MPMGFSDLDPAQVRDTTSLTLVPIFEEAFEQRMNNFYPGLRDPAKHSGFMTDEVCRSYRAKTKGKRSGLTATLGTASIIHSCSG